MAGKPILSEFIKGVNTDMAEEIIPDKYLSNGHNIRLTNDDNKQGIIQKQNGYRKRDGYPSNLYPLAVKEFDNVIYFVSLDKNDGVTIEYGTYPSGDPNNLIITPGVPFAMTKENVYRALPNFGTTAPYDNAFRTTDFGYTADSSVDIELQLSYDRSINIITSSADTQPRIVNSRLGFNADYVERITRGGDNLDNVYSTITIEKTLLIPEIGDMVPKLKFNGVSENSGNLINGGYKYYFKLKTADGLESPIIEESRLVSIHSGRDFGRANTYDDLTPTTNSVSFTISDIDNNAYKYVSVYYTRANGITSIPTKVGYLIKQSFEIVNNIANITHTGLEDDIETSIADIIAEYSPVISVGTINQKNNRLLLANIKSYSVIDERLQKAALCCYMEPDPVKRFTLEQLMYKGSALIDDTYANPNTIYATLPYFPGETYEFAINFVFKNGSISDSYPIMGYDYTNTAYPAFDYTLLGNIIGNTAGNGFDSALVQNSSGVVRMKSIPIEDTMENTSNASTLSQMGIYTMAINTSKMVTDYSTQLYDELGIRSYYVSRRKRIRDLEMEGLATTVASAPLAPMLLTSATSYAFGLYNGYGRTGSITSAYTLFPTPGGAIPVSTESLQVSGDLSVLSSVYADGIFYAPLANASLYNELAIYSPDIVCDSSYTTIINTKVARSVAFYKKLTQWIATKSTEAIVNTSGAYNMYPYCANPYTFENTPGTVKVTDINEFKYVGDSVGNYANGSFTGKLDRQYAVRMLTSLVSSTASDISDIKERWAQRDFFSAQMSTYGKADSIFILADILNGVTSDHEQVFVFKTGVNYSPYIGIRGNLLSTVVSYLDIPKGSSDDHGYFTFYDISDTMVPKEVDNTSLGINCSVYNNNTAAIMSSLKWKAKYSVRRNEGFFAITNRFKIDYSLDPAAIEWRDRMLHGGDCYAGFYYQQVWRPGGIEGIPTASTPSNYSFDDTGTSKTREGVNITSSGYTIGFPVRSRFNFAIRALEKEENEKLFSEARGYTSSYPTNVHGNRQKESSIINYGNIIEDSILNIQQNDPTVPYAKIDYPNRVITSEIAITGEFENGYRDFKGLNFKDYDESLGPIVAMTSNGLYTYLVYTSGVSIIEISERSAVSSGDTNTNVYIGESSTLPPKSTPKFTTFGSQHMHSVLSTEGSVYGVDAQVKKIWRIENTDTSVISDSSIQTVLNALITSDLTDIISSYEAYSREITFVFTYSDESQKSLLFNDKLKIWYGTTDMHKTHQFTIDEERLSVQKINNLYNLYCPVIDEQCVIIDGSTRDTKNSYVEFVVKHPALFEFNLSNIVINGTGVPTSIDILADGANSYNVGLADETVGGKIHNSLPLHTNIYMLDSQAVDLTYVDSYTFNRSIRADNVIFKQEDNITLDIGAAPSTLAQFIITNIVRDVTNGIDIITINHALTDNILNALYLGWKVPVRISLGEVMGGKTGITIPSKRHSALLKGEIIDEQGYHVNNSSTKPYGKWVKVRLNFDGTDQIYIASILSDTILRYS